MKEIVRQISLMLVCGMTCLSQTTAYAPKRSIRPFRLSELYLRTNLQIPLLDVMENTHLSSDDSFPILTPLPSSHLPAEVATPFLYGMQIDRPVHKLMIEEAVASKFGDEGPAMYGHLVWKSGDSLIGAIGCTSQILVNAPTTEVFNPGMAQDLNSRSKETVKSMTSNSNSKIPPSESPPSTLLCRGGFRFVVKDIVKTIPYPVAIVDEIEDDAEENDSDMFAAFSNGADDMDDEDMAKYASLSSTELIQKTMLGIQSIVSQKLEEANSKQLSPLEKQILEKSGVMIDPNAMEQAQAEEMVAVWEVFQASLVDDIPPKGRKYAVAIMAAELADMNNDVRQQVLLTRDSQERLRIVLKELDEIIGMERARKVASQITGKVDEDDRDLKVGQPQLPPWAKTILKGTRVEYFWNEDYGWIAGKVIQDPVTVVDEILLTVLFDDGETHTLPLTAEDKVRWRPPEK